VSETFEEYKITKALTNGTTIEVTLSTQEKKSVKIPIDKEVQIL
jgi:invasion protein IalB